MVPIAGLWPRVTGRAHLCWQVTNCADTRLVPAEEWGSAAFQAAHGTHWGRRYTAADAHVAWHVPAAAEVRWAVRLFNDCYAASASALEAALAGTLGKGRARARATLYPKIVFCIYKIYK